MHVTLKGINLSYLAQMKSHLEYHTQFGTGLSKDNLGKKQSRADEKKIARGLENINPHPSHFFFLQVI